MGRLEPILFYRSQLQTGAQHLKPFQVRHKLRNPVKFCTKGDRLAFRQLDPQFPGWAVGILHQVYGLLVCNHVLRRDAALQRKLPAFPQF